MSKYQHCRIIQHYRFGRRRRRRRRSNCRFHAVAVVGHHETLGEVFILYWGRLGSRGRGHYVIGLGRPRRHRRRHLRRTQSLQPQPRLHRVLIIRAGLISGLSGIPSVRTQRPRISARPQSHAGRHRDRDFARDVTGRVSVTVVAVVVTGRVVGVAHEADIEAAQLFVGASRASTSALHRVKLSLV